MGLTQDFEDACVKGLGPKAVDKGNCPDIARDMSNAIVSFIQKQTFTIVELKAILEVEEIKTVAPLQADILSTVQYINPAGAPSPLIGAPKGVQIPAIDYKSTGGGQGGLMISKGHAYIGKNPVDANETNESKTKVKLIKIVQIEVKYGLIN